MSVTETSNAMSLDELSCIMNLQRQEAFDDSLQNSKQSLSSKPQQEEPIEDNENAEEKLLKIIQTQAISSTKSPIRRHSSRPRAGSRQRSRRQLSEPIILAPEEAAEDTGVHSAQSNIDPTPNPTTSTANPLRTQSAIERPPVDRRGDYANTRSKSTTRWNSSRVIQKTASVDSNEKDHPPRREGRASRERRDGGRRGKSRSKSRGPTEGGGGSSRRSSSRARSRSRSKSNVRPRRRASSRASDNASVASGDHNNIQNMNACMASISSSASRRNSSLRRDLGRAQKSKRSGTRSDKSTSSAEDMSLSDANDLGKSKREMLREKSKQTIDGGVDVPNNHSKNAEGDSAESFDQIWSDEGENGGGAKGILGGYLKVSQRISRKSDPTDLRSLGSRNSLSTFDKSLGGGDRPGRKTKLEKIHELQAKCDRYKKEWIEVTREKKHCKKELQFNKIEVISLTKEIDTHIAETGILQKSLSESLQKMDQVQDEQRQERNDYSNAAKDLAQARIDHAKSLNDTREVRAELDQLEKTLAEKDRKIETLLEELKFSREKWDDIDADLHHAEREILKLEDELSRVEDELIKYRSAAEKDGHDGNVENLRKVREEMEQKLHDERERRLEQKQKKLEEKIHQFEEEQDRSLEKQKDRELELEDKQHLDGEKQKDREEERQRMDDEINQRLKGLEDDNTALQGRLKSEQLDSQVKLKRKDDSIENLQQDLMETNKQLCERDADPDGMTSLKQTVETAKAEASTAVEDLDEAQKHNGILEEEIEELQANSSELRGEVKELQKEVFSLKKESETYKRKAEEWQSKSSEWTDKAFLWKEKAEKWEQAAKEADSTATGEPSAPPVAVDPQALFLQAAFAKKKANNNTANEGSRWNVLRGLMNKGSEDESDTQFRVDELETENTEQAEIIKNLRSEMVRMQSQFKDQAYSNQQKMQELIKEREAVELKNTNLMKELELARKLESFASQDIL